MPQELTRGEIERRMAETEVDLEQYERLREGIDDYLASGIIGSINVGKHYTISDPKQREELAEWVANLLVQSLRYKEAVDEAVFEEGDHDDDE